MQHKRIVIYQTAMGGEPCTEYIDSLRDFAGAAGIRARIARAQFGNLGDHRSVGHGVLELRIHRGPGYRVYVALQGQECLVLLCAGDKESQDKDIRKAIAYWDEYRRSA